MSKKFDEDLENLNDMLREQQRRDEHWKTLELKRAIKNIPPDERAAAFEMATAQIAEDEEYMPLLLKARKMPIEELRRRLED